MFEYNPPCYISAALSVFIAGCWLGWPSPAVPKLLQGEASLKITSNEISWVVALMDFGNVLSPIPSGYLADYLGRKTTLLLTAFLYIVTWALVIFGKSAWYLYIARIGAGMGKGVAFTVLPMYLGEIAGVQVRGAISTIFPGLLSAGVLFEYCIGPFVTYSLLNIISGLLPILFFVAFFLLPESPYYLLMETRVQDAKTSLEWFRNKEIKNEAMNEELEEMKRTVEREIKEKGRFVDVVTTAGNRKALIIVTFLSAFQRFGGISPMLAYTVITLPKSGGYFKPDVYMIFFGITMVVGNVVSAPLMDSWGRKPLLLFSCTACAFCTGVSAMFYRSAGHNNNLEGLNWVPYLCFLGYGMSFSLGIISIPSIFVGELFPTNIKSHAAAIGTIFLAIASFSINKLYLFVKENYGTQYMYGFFTVCSIITVIFTMLMVFETKGKTFSEIQHKLNKNS